MVAERFRWMCMDYLMTLHPLQRLLSSTECYENIIVFSEMTDLKKKAGLWPILK
jgi:hypothetical protein